MLLKYAKNKRQKDKYKSSILNYWYKKLAQNFYFSRYFCEHNVSEQSLMLQSILVSDKKLGRFVCRLIWASWHCLTVTKGQLGGVCP